MRNCKKMLAILLCIAAILMLSTVAFAAGSNVSSKLSANEVKVGDTFTMTVSMSNTTISSLGVNVSVDDAFEIVSGEWLQSGLIASYNAAKQQGAFKPSGTVEMSGDIFKLTLKAKTAGASAKNVSITVVAKNSTTTVFEEATSKTVKVGCTSHAFGAYEKNNAEHSRTCTACGYVEKASHTWNSGTVTTPATCTKEGVKTFTCTTCSHTKTESVNKIAHTYGAWTKVDEANHSKSCSCGDTVTAKHSWDNGKVTTAATCSKEGVKTYTCSDCGATKTDTIAKTAHTYGKWTKVDANNHIKSCSCGDSVQEKHTWDNGKVTTAATCSKEGVKTYTCSGCGATKTEAINKIAHTYSNACDTSCNNCGETRTTTHQYESKWSSDSQSHWHKCSVCGDKADNAAHTASDWIVDKEASALSAGSRHTECTVCKKVLKTESIPATGCKHGETKVAGVKDATCEEDGYTGDTVCVICNTVMTPGSVIPANGHDIETTGAKDASCTEEGFTGKQVCKTCSNTVDEGSVIAKVPHSFTDGICTVCNATDPDFTQPTEPSAPAETEPTKPAAPTEPTAPSVSQTNPNDNSTGIIIGVVIAVAAAAVILILLLLKRKKQN